MKKRTLFVTQAAVIAAIYVVLSFVVNLIPGNLNYGLVQFRLAEVLCVLPAFIPAAIPGLFIGCLITNLFSNAGLPDLILGSFATLVAALLTYWFRKYKWFAPVPPIVVNALVIGPMLYFYIPEIFEGLSSYAPSIVILISVGAVALGEAVVCMGLGYPLMKLIGKNRRILGE